MEPNYESSGSSDALYSHFCNHKGSCKVCEASKVYLWLIQNMLEVHKKVQDSGKYNFQHCRIRVNDKINVEYMRVMLGDYQDLQVCDLLEFGFPLDFEGDIYNLSTKDQIWQYKNHKGTLEIPDHINAYITNECSHRAILRPFKKNPFLEWI